MVKYAGHLHTSHTGTMLAMAGWWKYPCPCGNGGRNECYQRLSTATSFSPSPLQRIILIYLSLQSSNLLCPLSIPNFTATFTPTTVTPHPILKIPSSHSHSPCSSSLLFPLTSFLTYPSYLHKTLPHFKPPEIYRFGLVAEMHLHRSSPYGKVTLDNGWTFVPQDNNQVLCSWEKTHCPKCYEGLKKSNNYIWWILW